MTRPRRPRAPMTGTATASSWARARAAWCWRIPEHAKARGAQNLCRNDRLWHVGRRLSHHRAGRGRRRRLPLHAGGDQAGGTRRRDIDYVNAHGTSTMADGIELARGRAAVRRRRAGKISMSSTKSSIGHLLGAAGAVEAIFCMLAMRDGRSRRRPSISKIPQSRRGSTSCRTRRDRAEIDIVLSNSFGFGGTNASLIMRRFV